MTPERGETLYDLAVVGAGPAGLSAAWTARECGLSCVVLERGEVAQTVADYPLGKPLHSPCEEVELAWGELHTDRHRPTREEVLAHYAQFARERLRLRTREEVTAIERAPRGLRLRSSAGGCEARNVLLATGGFGIARRLGVPGETAGRVSYRFYDGRPYAGREVLVVGGGNSAAEAALWLHELGARVTLSLRRPSFAPRGGKRDLFTSVKTFNSERLEGLAARGGIRILYRSRVLELLPRAAIVEVEGETRTRVIPCSHVFALIGADPDLALLRGAGAAIGGDGRPLYDPQTYETSVPGLYVAGHLTREIHMAPAIAIPRRIVLRIAGEQAGRRGAGVAAGVLARAAKALRRRSAAARRAIRGYPALRRAVQRIEQANALREPRPSLARRLVRRHPVLRRAAQLLRAWLRPAALSQR